MSSELSSRKVSFQKKVQQVNDIPGAKLSLKNSQLNISSGIPSLDYFLGGGLTVGSIVLVEEDKYAKYASIIMKYFLAEGVVNKHSILLSSGDENPQHILEDLPAVVTDKIHCDAVYVEHESPSDGKMKIAWRYQNMPRIKESSSSNQFGHQYILGKRMDPESIKACTPITIDITSDIHHISEKVSQTFLSDSCSVIIHRIQETIKQGSFNTNSTCSQRNILRIVVHSLGSPMWTESNCTKKESNFRLLRFLYILKSLTRSAFSVTVVTVPVHLIQDQVLVERMRQICDTVLNLESFASSEKEVHPAYKDYNGLIKLIKVPHLNTLKSHAPNADDLAFRLHRRSLTIEKFHLPPLLDDEPSRSTQTKTKMHHEPLTCGSNKKNFDF